MADQVTHGTGGSSNDTLRSLTEKAAAAGSDLKSKASELARSSAEQMKGQAAEISDKAKDVARPGKGGSLRKPCPNAKWPARDYVGGIAEAIRRA